MIDTGIAELPRRVREMLADGHRLALAAAHHDGADAPGGPAIRVVYLFVKGPPDSRVELHVRLDPDTPALPSLAHLSFPAGRFEREMRDLHGIVPLNHPLPRRLVRHPHWPRGWYPMRPDAGPPPPFAEPEGPFPFLTVEGDGVYEIPVGPVHAGLIEPGHFRFSVVGETILKLKARLWFVHKGIEKLFERRDVARGLPLAERISGDTAVGHALAYCLAVEEATATAVPEPARRARALLLELERLHNHVADLGALCNDVGHGILNAQAQRVREQLLRLNQEVTGHRLLRGGVVPGGAAVRALPDPARMRAIGDDIRDIVALALGHSTVRDRFAGAARLDGRAARDLGCLGYVARASGVRVDARQAHPFLDYGDALTVPVHTSGDVLARFLIRAEEIDVSLALVETLAAGLTSGVTRAELAPGPASRSAHGLGPGPASAPGPASGAGRDDLPGRPGPLLKPGSDADPGSGLGPTGRLPGPGAGVGPGGPDVGPGVGAGSGTGIASGVGIVEGWRGTITTRVELAPDRTLARVKVVDPSFFNWPALPIALADTIVPDFPLTNKSFNLSYAGNDL
ncbi:MULTISPECIES: NADH-quinone oxidoreductase subunit C [unclassified Frankia]|uniref:NADH-quinone oxidoreductase subunit D-related protein n=1 Tax=unclassified Frankia TaxID=2632575 RepID=UPI0020256CED